MLTDAAVAAAAVVAVVVVVAAALLSAVGRCSGGDFAGDGGADDEVYLILVAPGSHGARPSPQLVLGGPAV